MKCSVLMRSYVVVVVVFCCFFFFCLFVILLFLVFNNVRKGNENRVLSDGGMNFG